MTLSNFISKLNWRLIVIHLIACWFFIYSFVMFSYLHDHAFLMDLLSRPKSWLNNPKNWFNEPQNRNITPSVIAIDALWISLSKPIGLLSCCVISMVMTIKKHWFWVNSLLVFFVAILLMRYHLFGWDYFGHIFRAPGRLFKEYSIGYFLTNGLVMLSIGLLLLFLKPVQQFIKPIAVSEQQDEAAQPDSDPQTDAINN